MFIGKVSWPAGSVCWKLSSVGAGAVVVKNVESHITVSSVSIKNNDNDLGHNL